MTSWPSAARAWGREPATSARPPVLMKGAASGVAKRIFIEITFSKNYWGIFVVGRDHWARRGAVSHQTGRRVVAPYKRQGSQEDALRIGEGVRKNQTTEPLAIARG